MSSQGERAHTFVTESFRTVSITGRTAGRSFPHYPHAMSTPEPPSPAAPLPHPSAASSPTASDPSARAPLDEVEGGDEAYEGPPVPEPPRRVPFGISVVTALLGV